MPEKPTPNSPEALEYAKEHWVLKEKDQRVGKAFRILKQEGYIGGYERANSVANLVRNPHIHYVVITERGPAPVSTLTQKRDAQKSRANYLELKYTCVAAYTGSGKWRAPELIAKLIYDGVNRFFDPGSEEAVRVRSAFQSKLAGL